MGNQYRNEFSLLKFACYIFNYNFPRDDIKRRFSVLLYVNMMKAGVSSALHSEFAKILFAGNVPSCILDSEINESIRMINKKCKISKKLFSPMVTYKYLIILASAYIHNLCGKRDSLLFLDIYQKHKINKEQKQILETYIGLLESGRTNELLSFFQYSKLKRHSITVNLLSIFIKDECKYYNLPESNISVYSTMSAGKSTFINALLERNCLPSKNEACTQKIISIANASRVGYCNRVGYCLGYAVRNGERVFCGNVELKKIEEWNIDSKVTEITLEANFNGIKCEKTALVIHDTPGLNYSGNASHKKTTLDHLAALLPDVVICLLDATQMHTTDFSNALKDLREVTEKNNKTEILFVINKADSYDPEKESLGKAVSDAVDELKKHGFDNPAVIPVSSHAAGLFKTALNRQAEFTAREKKLFADYFCYFFKDQNNFRQFAFGVSDVFPHNREYLTQGDAEIVLEGKTYNGRQIEEALFNTGIPVVENILQRRTLK